MPFKNICCYQIITYIVCHYNQTRFVSKTVQFFYLQGSVGKKTDHWFKNHLFIEHSLVVSKTDWCSLVLAFTHAQNIITGALKQELFFFKSTLLYFLIGVSHINFLGISNIPILARHLISNSDISRYCTGLVIFIYLQTPVCI